MSRWLVIGGLELCLFAGAFLIDANWAQQNAPTLVVVGAVILMSGLVVDHLPRGIAAIHQHNWLPMHVAARHFRDLLGDPTPGSAAEMFDGLVRDSRSDRPLESVFQSWMLDGINRERIVAYGRPRNGRKKVRIVPPVSEDVTAQNSTGTVFAGGQEFVDIEIKRVTLPAYIDWMRSP